MKKFKVKETFRITVYTYIDAESKEHVKDRLENGIFETDFNEHLDEFYLETDWDSLQEI